MAFDPPKGTTKIGSTRYVRKESTPLLLRKGHQTVAKLKMNRWTVLSLLRPENLAVRAPHVRFRARHGSTAGGKFG